MNENTSIACSVNFGHGQMCLLYLIFIKQCHKHGFWNTQIDWWRLTTKAHAAVIVIDCFLLLIFERKYVFIAWNGSFQWQCLNHVDTLFIVIWTILLIWELCVWIRLFCSCKLIFKSMHNQMRIYFKMQQKLIYKHMTYARCGFHAIHFRSFTYLLRCSMKSLSRKYSTRFASSLCSRMKWCVSFWSCDSVFRNSIPTLSE